MTPAVTLELVIFDCDGVLVDSEAISNRVLAAMLSERGLPTTLAQARREFQGMLLADVLARAEARLGRPLPDGWLARYEVERAEAFRRELQPVAGAVEVVERLRGGGLRVCVASQGKLEKTRLSLALTGLDRLFPEHVRFSAYSVANGKPAPDLFLHAAATIGVEPAACAVVEDTPSGVQAAVAAGMRAIGYTPDSDERALVEAGAEPLSSLDELPQLLGPGRGDCGESPGASRPAGDGTQAEAPAIRISLLGPFEIEGVDHAGSGGDARAFSARGGLSCCRQHQRNVARRVSPPGLWYNIWYQIKGDGYGDHG